MTATAAEASKAEKAGAESEGQKCGGCGKDTDESLKCPLCIRFELPDSYFCSQTCFKANLKTHAEIHKSSPVFRQLHDRTANPGSSMSTGASVSTGVTEGKESVALGFKEDDFGTWGRDRHLSRFIRKCFPFTGPLRPWPITPRRSVPAHIPRPDYAQFGISRAEQNDLRNPIKCNNQEEVACIREACRLGREALDLAHSMCKPGVTPDAIDEAVHNFLTERNAYPSPLNYFYFPKSCCVSINEVICHGIPDLRPLRDGDIVNVDITAYYKGFHGDLNETYVVGETVDAEGKRLIKAAHDALQLAISICKPGVPYKEIGEVIAPFVKAQGFSVVRTFTGHGCGKLFHTNPNVMHYANNRAKGIMRPGHVFTIEPMINEGTHRDVVWPDDWTAVTADGKRSAQFEHQLLITEDGCEVLTARLPTSPPLHFTPENQRTETNTSAASE